MGWRQPNKRQVLLLRWGGGSALGVLLVVLVIVVSTRQVHRAVPSVGVGVEGVTSVLTRDLAAADVPIRFEDVTEKLGVRFHHFPAARASLLPEDMGSGVAAGDYDGDGYPDLFFVNFAGSVLPGAPMDRDQGKCRLFHNIRGDRFEDVTDRAGLGLVGYGMGAAWGDYDNDGDLDLYVTAMGPNALYQNQGDGTFRDVTEAARVQDTRFSSGCAWGDFDRDGNIDLYVCNYVDFVFRESERGITVRQHSTEEPYTLNPASYPPLPNSLFRNTGDGAFEEVARQTGTANPTGRGLAVNWVDLDNDGWSDLYVANDVSDNGVFRNRGDGTFEDIGASSMAADYRSAMGVAIADFDDDLDQDIFITHWIAQENALYRNMLDLSAAPEQSSRRLWFADSADEFGLGQIALDMVGWATGWCDFDNDGQRDLWLVNGSTMEQRDHHELLVPQNAFVFSNQGKRGFMDVAAKTCPRLAQPFVGRGGAQVDFDRDGRVDLVLVVHGGQPMILRNVSPGRHHWLGVELRQTGGNTLALGARVFLTAGGHTQMAEVGCSASYLSQDEARLHFGLGDHASVDSLRIVWSDGFEETHVPRKVDESLTLVHHARYPWKHD